MVLSGRSTHKGSKLNTDPLTVPQLQALEIASQGLALKAMPSQYKPHDHSTRPHPAPSRHPPQLQRRHRG